MIAVSETGGILRRLWQTGYRVAARGVLSAGFDVPFHAAAAFAAERSAWLVREVDGVTQARVRAVLEAVLGPTLSNPEVGPQDVAAALEAEFAEMSRYRAELIARTETAYAMAYGNAEAWRDGGVTHVEISDGDYDDACAEADGEIWTLEEYLANPLEHPNCTRAAYPVIEATEAAA